ncbi:MAG: hypothetical protein JXR67_02115 [Bacteroidales bacterium]|nr:hypothetical protein [Bacteroidales bacterium]
MVGLFRIILLFTLIIAGSLYLSSSAGMTFQEEAPVGLMETACSAIYEGYRDAVPFRGLFLAVGTGGRIDLIDASGSRIKTFNEHRGDMNCAVVWEQLVLVAGEGGAVLWSADGNEFELAVSGTGKDINGIAARQDMIVAGADEGTILISVNGRSWNIIEPGAKGNIVSVTAGESFFMAVTDEGEILRSDDGLNWLVTDYNKEYSGFYKPCLFYEVVAAGSNIVICGKHPDGSPAVITSTLGNVWTERLLSYKHDQRNIRFLSNCPNSVAYDQPRDQYILACDMGEIFSLPSCTKCNASAIISGNDLHTIACLDDMLFCGGEGFSVNVVSF